jgi:hypothetical protein
MHCRAVLPTAGLGNKLFPWARCRRFALEHGLEMLAPAWTQLKLGPIVRNEHDKRLYYNLFRPSPTGYTHGARAVLLRLTERHALPEPVDLGAPVDRQARAGVTFRGPNGHFGPLTGWHSTMLHELRSMTRLRWVHGADAVGSVTVGIHVRRGDFAEPRSPDEYWSRGSLRTPLAWFLRSLRLLRAIGDANLPAVVVSDATDSALRELLAEPNVRRVDTGSAIGDLLALSRSRVLIASGGSTFSAWAAYLGQMPSVAHPGQSLSWYRIMPQCGQFIGELDPDGAAPMPLVDNVRAVRREVATV